MIFPPAFSYFLIIYYIRRQGGLRFVFSPPYIFSLTLALSQRERELAVASMKLFY